MTCDNCKKYFTTGNRPDGLPNGVSMVTRSKVKITLCADCLISLGQMDAKQKDEFFRKLNNNTN